jgi:MFS family permease
LPLPGCQIEKLIFFSFRYLLGQGIGGAILPPYSECFGRRTLYLLSTIGYCAFSIVVATVPSLPLVMVARFICGFLSAIPTIVVAGSMEDMYNMRARVWMIFVWVTTGNMGIILGPIFSTYVTITLGWFVQPMPLKAPTFDAYVRLLTLILGAGFSISQPASQVYSSYYVSG